MSRVVDAHAHIASPAALDEMRTLHPDGIPQLEATGGEALLLRYPNGVVNGPVPVGLVEPDVRIADMDRQGVAHQVLSTRPQMFTYDLPGDVAAPLAAIANDALVELAGKHPDRFSALISLPLQDPARAVAEIERLSTDRDVRGAFVDSNLAGRNLDDPAFSPVWAALEAADLPVLVHPYQADTLGRERLGSYYLFNLIGNPADTSVAVASVIFGGLLARYPRLRWGFVHGGGVAPYLLGRWDHGHRVRPEPKEHLGASRPSAMFGRLFFDSLVHHPLVLRFLVDLVGADQVMLGSDYPFDMGQQDPAGTLLSYGLSGRQEEAILTGTSNRFLRSR